MKFKCKNKEIIKGLNTVTKTVATKTTLPIQEGVLIEAKDNYIKLTTNDLEIGTEYILDSVIEEGGSTVVDIKTLNEIIRKIEGDEINFQVADGVFVIKSSSGIFKLQTMNADEYKRLPVFKVEKQIELPQQELKEMIKKTIFSASIDSVNRPVYVGCLMTIENNVLTMVAIDGYRMAVRKEYLKESSSDFKAIIPAKTLSEISRILEDGFSGTIKIGVNENQALFNIENCTMVSRIISGEFLDYNNIIPAEFETKVTVNKRKLLDSIERIAIFTKQIDEKAKTVPIKFLLEVEGMELSCTSKTGDAKEKVNAVVNGAQNIIGFNSRYLIEALRAVDDEEIELNFCGTVAPMIIKGPKSNSYVYMVLPVNLQEREK